MGHRPINWWMRGVGTRFNQNGPSLRENVSSGTWSDKF